MLLMIIVVVILVIVDYGSYHCSDYHLTTLATGSQAYN